MRLLFGVLLILSSLAAISLPGCSVPAEEAVTSAVESDQHAGHDHGEGEHAEHDHSGWWCNEHGVPEEECALCDTSLVADFKADDDWCDEHNRPESQCFVCNPDNFESFAARYEAKFGERPPQPTE